MSEPTRNNKEKITTRIIIFMMLLLFFVQMAIWRNISSMVHLLEIQTQFLETQQVTSFERGSDKIPISAQQKKSPVYTPKGSRESI